MTISRGELPDGNYTLVSNEWLRDRRLSAKAKGLLAYIVSHTSGWSLTIAQMCDEMADSRTSIDSGLAELVSTGYLKRSRERGRDGRLSAYSYLVTPPLVEATADYPPWKTYTGPDQAEQGVSAAHDQSTESTVETERTKKTTPSEKKTNEKTSRADRATKLPEDWKPGEALMKWCLSVVPGGRWSPESRQFVLDQHGRFADHWRATGKRFVDWDATWRNWMRKAFERDYRGAATARPEPKSFRQQDAERADAEIERMRLTQDYIDRGMDRKAAYQQAGRDMAAKPVETNAGVPYIDGVFSETTAREVTSE